MSDTINRSVRLTYLYIHTYLRKMSGHSPVNQNVYDAFEDFFKQIISETKTDSIPIKYEKKYHEVDSSKVVASPYYRELEVQEMRSVRNSNWDDIVDALIESSYYDRTQEDLEDENIPVEGAILNDLIDSFWSLYLRKSSRLLSFERDTFDYVFERMEEYLQMDKIPYRAWVFFQNLYIDTESIELSDNIVIRRLTAEDKNYLLDKKHPKSAYLGEAVHPTSVLECTYEVDKNSPNVSEYPKKEFKRVETALRLFDANPRTFYDRGFAVSDPEFETKNETKAILREGRSPLGLESYVLEDEKKSKFVNFYQKYKHLIKTESDSEFTRPLHRLNQMYEKGYADSIVDCAIALEQTVLKEMSQDASYTFRLALRGSLLIDERVDYDRDELRLFFRSLYYARGEIVHSDKPIETIISREDFQESSFISDEDRKTNKRQFVQTARHLLSEIIKEYMQNRVDRGISIEDLNREVDKAVYDADY